MKRKALVFTLVASIVCLCSCNVQRKAEKLVEKYVKDCLFVPGSYGAIDTVVDSAFFSPIMDEDIVSKVQEILDTECKIAELENRLKTVEVEMKHAKSSMSIWSDRGSSYARDQYQNAKEEYEHAQQVMADVNDVIAGFNQLIADYEESIIERARTNEHMGQFVGWFIGHRYRAETQGGMKTISDIEIVSDPQLKEVLLAFDSRDEQQMLIFDRLKSILER